MMISQSILQNARSQYRPKLPKILANINDVHVEAFPQIIHPPFGQELQKIFPHTLGQNPLSIKIGRIEEKKRKQLRIGVVFSGGQAPGGHNVISGIFDALKALNPENLLFGFCNGPSGIIHNTSIEITESKLAPFRNQGGFDLIGSGRTKINTAEQLIAAEKSVRSLELDGLIIIGGDDSNTNASLLAESFKASRCKTCVVGVPKTIDGDLKSEEVEISFGFDTASKTFAAIIGDIMRDAISAKKYYYFIKLMGRSASHLTLECALKTHPNIVLIAEEIAEKKQTLSSIIQEICDVICLRTIQKKDYGVILIPEGVIEFIPEFRTLIEELNTLLAYEKTEVPQAATVAKHLSSSSANCFLALPSVIQTQLLLARDPHGNVQVSKIETERLFMQMVENELKKRKIKGEYSGKFIAQPLFCGYEGRSCLPSNFDCQYCYALGHVASLLVDAEVSGYLCCVKNLSASVDDWQAGGIPFTHLMGLEMRHGLPTPVIKKALVDLKGKPFSHLELYRKKWSMEDSYLSPGPIQFYGPADLTDNITLTLSLEQEK